MTLLNGPVDALSSVTCLELDAVSLTAAQLHLIVSLPRLRSLHLEVVHCDVPETPPPVGFHLDELWLFGPSDGRLATSLLVPAPPLLQYLGFPHIRHFVYDACAEWLDAMTTSPRSRPHTILVEKWDDVHLSNGISFPCDAWRMSDGAGFISDQYGAHTNDDLSWADVREIFEDLLELVIPYRVLRMADYNLEFRNLTRLCVRIDDPISTSRAWPKFRAVRCPRLRTLELWDGGVSIAAAEIVEFVRDFFVFDAQHPPELIIRDVRLIPSSAPLTELRELVSAIQRPDGPARESFVVELKSQWHVAVRR
ncbi:hypothetical protein AURDEDRAFT_174489 [Auricularia subglabra TFB-10046 SS5]|uniref:F-box domain-containing protein n=1 Tax=Auricularia subglabra (strain TFB-10046 / SS5) TaxID=717982 RepID=J0CYP9_AURST|nr:hypothetical protein AURDEDRAFT_174489 [Auricularia subglabra TFB-10046 SS5]